MSSDNDLAMVVAMTGLDPERAKNLLEAAGNNIESAVNLHLANQEFGSQEPQRSKSAPNPSLYEQQTGVRAPIAAKKDTLVGGSIGMRPIGYQRPQRSARTDPFRTFSDEPRGSSRTKKAKEKESALSRLFEPPLHLLFAGDFTAARTAAERAGKHVLVNIQDPQNFDCQRLNRDVWKNDVVMDMIKERFVFWQQYADSDAAQQYRSWYPFTDMPHVAIISGQTGERLNVLPSKLNADGFLERVWSLDDGHVPSSSASVPTTAAPMSEEEQLRLAMAASLETTNDVVTIDDDDDTDDEDNDNVMDTDENTQLDSQDATEVLSDTLELREEPTKGTDGTCTIRFILPDNSRLQRNFYLEETVAHLVHYLKHNADIPSNTFRMMHGRPPADLKDKAGSTTLGEMGMRSEVVRIDHD
eukprot:TRINITY_DN10191_c0_g2_i1.p1 TRINITY_DN10191_c0_g2~~TRINITY_DN10191_c0_g2_i1.p1  ORF type:complete len:414 (+),score=103.48 TRINITY_DN10191_c0_g2_i1:71-1312(+)